MKDENLYKKYKKPNRVEDLTGKQFDKWQVLKYAGIHIRTGKVYFQCKCQCGNISNIGASFLRNNKTHGCQECKNRLDDNIIGSNSINRSYFTRIRHRANKKGIEFNISREDIYNTIKHQNFVCALSGLPIIFADSCKKQENGITTASVDRINSELGYTLNNIQIVHKKINKMKWSFRQNYFIKLCELITYFDQQFIDRDIPRPQRFMTFQGYEQITKTYWNDLKRHAKKRDISFNINIKSAWELYYNIQHGQCYFTGVFIDFPSSYHPKIAKQQTASLDRIDSYKEYSISNCVWVHKDVNLIKCNLYIDEFKYLCSCVSQYQKSKKCASTPVQN